MSKTASPAKWYKLLRKYRNLFSRIQKNKQFNPQLCKRLLFRLYELKRRILRSWKRWKIAIPFALLSTWLDNPIQAQNYPAVINTSEINGDNGFVIVRKAISPFNRLANQNLNKVVSSAGDLNGDGFDDLIIGEPTSNFESVENAGQAFVVFGTDRKLNRQNELLDLVANNGIALNTPIISFLGITVSDLEDFNGDGLNDVVIGSVVGTYNNQAIEGTSYVLFGSRNGFSKSIDLFNSDLNSGFRLEANWVDQSVSTTHISNAGDINGDGLSDIIIGTPLKYNDNFENIGEAFVLFGTNIFPTDTVELTTLDEDNGFVILPKFNSSSTYTGDNVSNAGDLNGDGFDDFIVGTRFTVPSGPLSNATDAEWESYIIFGNENFEKELDLNLLDGNNGFTLKGTIKDGWNDIDRIHMSLSGLGDFNGDGIDDFAIGIPSDIFGQDENPLGISLGSSYIIFGRSEGIEAEFDVSNLDGTNGFKIENPLNEGRIGYSLSMVEDISGDGLNEIIIGDPYSSRVYVVFGDSSFSSGNIDISNLDGKNGFIIDGTEGLGRSVTDLGDFNGDGMNDFAVEAWSEDPSNREMINREIFVLFGGEGVPTSNNNLFDSQDLTLFPNPSSELISVKLNRDFPSGYKIKIFDQIGRELHTPLRRQISANEIEIDVSSMIPGVYYLHLTTTDGKSIAKHFIRE